MTDLVLSSRIATISDLKKNPIKVVGQNEAVAILNRNKPAFYCIPAKAYEDLLNRLEDMELNALADARAGQERIKVDLDDL